MTPRRLLLLAGATALVAATTTAAWRLFWIPTQRLGDVEFLERASDDELVDTAERVLWLPFGNHHDACLIVGEAGDVSSVPSLLQGLRYDPPLEDGMVCTTMHCLDALRLITGHDAGSSPEAWEEWWRTTGAALPASAFPLGCTSAPHPPRPRAAATPARRRQTERCGAGAGTSTGSSATGP